MATYLVAGLVWKGRPLVARKPKRPYQGGQQRRGRGGSHQMEEFCIVAFLIFKNGLENTISISHSK